MSRQAFPRGLLLAGLIAAAGPALAVSDYPPLKPAAVVQDCGTEAASPDICRLRELPSADEVEHRLGATASGVWRDGDRFFVAARGDEPVSVAASVNAPLTRIEGTSLWALVLRIPRLDEAVLDVFTQPSGHELVMLEWRGPRAPAAPGLKAELAGQVIFERIPSRALSAERAVTVYLPPGFAKGRTYPVVYVGDGSGVAFYCRIVEPAILDGRLPPLVMVGLDSGGDEQRSSDYLLGWKGTDAGFEAHERFLIDEVMPRAERLWGASKRRQDRLIMGKSSGGAWALDTALRNPALFGQAAPMAVGAGRWTGIDKPGRPRLFMATGLFDNFIAKSRQAAALAAKSSSEVVFRNPVTGHGDLFYQGLIVEVLAWAFGPPIDRDRFRP